MTVSAYNDNIWLMVKLLALFLGGGAGTLTRYFVSSHSSRMIESGFPFGTTVVNVSGSFIIGFLWAFMELVNMSPNLRAFIFIGFLGGYTTFSTYMMENLNLLRGGETKAMMTNILLSNIAGLVLVVAGFFIGRYFVNFLRG